MQAVFPHSAGAIFEANLKSSGPPMQAMSALLSLM
jgi:hypothetical protein